MRTIGFMTLGCKTNQYDSQAMAQAFQRAGYALRGFDEICDIYLINGCMVTGTGEHKSMKFVRQAARRNPSAQIIVAGCLAQSKGEKLFLPGVRLVIGNQHRGKVVELFERAERENIALCAVESLQSAAFEPLDVRLMEGRTRAVLKIQEGCENRCSYCIIPDLRGPVRSSPLALVAEQAAELSRDFAEIVVTGIHLASYGRDLGGVELVDALEAIGRAPGLQRLRLGSLEPKYITEETVERLRAIPSLCPQFHLSLQSGSDKLLALMRRQYNTQRFRHAVELLRRAFPDAAITTDVICGFPGESEQDFAQTVDFCKEIGFARMHVFPYSEREGTPAATFPGRVETALREERARRLIAVGKALEAAYAKTFVGREVEALIEERGMGYTRQYLRLEAKGAEPGRLLRARVARAQGGKLFAEETSDLL